MPGDLCRITEFIEASAPDGAALYKTRCAMCHDGKPQLHIPSAPVAAQSSASATSDNTVKAELRRLMLEKIHTDAGQSGGSQHGMLPACLSRRLIRIGGGT